MQGFDLTGVLLYTSEENFDAMRAFYVNVLGLEPRSDRSQFVNFEFGQSRLTVAVHAHVVGPTVEPHRIMVNLGTVNIHKEAKRLMALGVECTRQPEQESWGGWIATFTDPDGNAIQFLQQP